MRKLTVVLLLGAFVLCAAAVPALHAQDVAAIQDKIKILEAQNAGVDEALTFFETQIKGVEDQSVVIMVGYPWPVPRKVFEAYIEARLRNKSLTPEEAEKLTQTSIDKVVEWLPVAKKVLTELQDAHEKDKDELSYLYNERARLSPPTAPPLPAAFVPQWPGTWKTNGSNSTVVIAGSGSGLSAHVTWTGDLPNQSSTEDWSTFKATNELTL